MKVIESVPISQDERIAVKLASPSLPQGICFYLNLNSYCKLEMGRTRPCRAPQRSSPQVGLTWMMRWTWIETDIGDGDIGKEDCYTACLIVD